MVPAGERRCFCKIQRINNTRNGAALDRTPQDLFTCWAKISTTGGREFQQAKAMTPQLSHEVTIRWRRDIQPTAKDIFVFGAREFDISAVINVMERNEDLMLHCVERVK